MKSSEARATVEAMRARLNVVCARITLAMGNVREWSSLGYPSTSGPIGGGRGGNGDTAIERAVLSGRRDPYADDMREAVVRLLRCSDDVAWLERFVLRNTETHEREPELIDCGNPKCDRTMTGLPNDRPRDGRCERCYRWKRRNGADWPSYGSPATAASVGTEAP